MRCAIVGSGLGGARRLRDAAARRDRSPARSTVFGTHEDPTAAWRERAAAIRQRRMRSESDGHLAAASFPGLALRETLRERPLRPLLADGCRTATTRRSQTFLRHAGERRRRSGWEQSFVRAPHRAHPRRRRRLRAGRRQGRSSTCSSRPGIPGLAQRLPGAVHAYEPHEYAAQVAIVGAGMAAATEWLNALAPERRWSRCAGTSRCAGRSTCRGRTSPSAASPRSTRFRDRQRAARLRELAAPSYPPGRAWDDPLRAADRRRFRVETAPPHGFQVIAATGFKKGYATRPAARRSRRRARARDTRTLDRARPGLDRPALTDETRTLSLAGVAAQWAFPAADTIAGAKYAARAFLRRACRTR